jgi:peptidyl-prolyl cis-trans isomerase C
MTLFPHGSAKVPARLLAVAMALGAPAGGLALAQTASAPPAAATATTAADPVLATVDGAPIRTSDLSLAAESLPPQARSLPPQQLYPMLLDQLIDARALLEAARRQGLDKDPDVQRAVQAAQDRALETALLNKVVRPQVTDAAVKARFDQDNAGKSGEPEIHARHILVADEATAKKITADLKKGGDFAALSKQYSKDPGASAQGGDLGFFKKADMVPEFSAAAFTLKDGEITPVPVHTQFGWHVIQVIEHRTSQPPAYEDVRDQLRQQMVQAAVQKEVTAARAAVKVEVFNSDGTPAKATDLAEPPPAK